MGICTGRFHCLAWDVNGKIYSWGSSLSGKLGHHIGECPESILYQPKKVQKRKLLYFVGKRKYLNGLS